MLTYRCYGRHGQGKQERTDGREAAASYLLIEEAVCPICKSRDHVEVESRLYWCTHCRIPLYEKNCPLCHAPAEEFVRDCRIVFPEEKRLLELLMEAEPGTYDHSSVWNGGGIYYADGLRLPLEITKLSEEQIRRAAQKIPEAFRNIDTREFERMRERFVRANCRRFCELETEAVDYIRTSVERYGISKCYVSFSGGKDSTVVAELVRRALGMELMHGFADTTLELPQTLEYIRRYRRSHPDIYFIDAKSRGEQFEALCEILGPPSRVMRWCCTVFKTSALNRRLEMCFPEGEILSFQGIRRAERSQHRRSSTGRTLMYGCILPQQGLTLIRRIVWDMPEWDAGAVPITVHGQKYWHRFICRSSIAALSDCFLILRSKQIKRIRKSMSAPDNGKRDWEDTVLRMQNSRSFRIRPVSMKRMRIIMN